MKVYFPNIKEDGIGGGWTALRNLRKGLADKVQFAHSVEECDIYFVNGVTMVDKNEVYRAHELGKKIVFRVDNVPRNSRNRGGGMHNRMKKFAEIAEVVIYQSEWAKKYCYPLCGDGVVIYNGVDTNIFKPNLEKQNINRYLFAYHGKNEQKNFWEAHLRFQFIARDNPDAEFWFIYDFGSETQRLQEANFDFWQGEDITHVNAVTRPEDMANIMQQCRYLIYPAISDASPNIVTEARACGLEVINAAPKELAGTQELLDPDLDISLERMADEYFGVFQVAMQNI